MRLLNLFKNKKKKEKQENNQVFEMHLLFDEYVDLPDEKEFQSVMSQYLGNIKCYKHDQKGAGITLLDYQVELADGTVPLMLTISKCKSIDDLEIDNMTRSQMWHVEDSEEILQKAKYHICCADMMGNLIPIYQRIKINMDYMEAMAHLFPQASAIYLLPSGNLLEREDIIYHDYDNDDERFVYFAVNIRIFFSKEKNMRVVDTVGMDLLGLPDLQYRFCDFDVSDVVNHAYHMCCYLLDCDEWIENGDTIDGMKDGHICDDVVWLCYYEDSLLQPSRIVIDVDINEHSLKKENH